MTVLLLFLHVVGAVVWVGGMFFAHFALRPAAADTLAPPQRLPLMAATLARFFRIVLVTAVVVLATGGVLMARLAPGAPPLGWTIMAALGAVMTAVFAYIYAVPYPRLQRGVAASAWPDAAAALGVIRRLVALNLALGFVVIASAIAARA